MAYDYNKLYGETSNALGEPTAEFVNFFDSYTKSNAKILDIGCGQGRDALFIARLGHYVVGVDLAANGVRDLLSAAKREGLMVEGVVADITQYVPSDVYDVVLIDRTLHMLPEKPRLQTLTKLLEHVAIDGYLLIADQSSNIEMFKSELANHAADWEFVYAKRGYLFARRF